MSGDAGAPEADLARVWATAYRLLGSVADADDAVQAALLRWVEAAPASVDSATAWLITAVTRLCIDELRSVRRRRVRYVGPWLPEPLLDGAHPLPADLVERDESLSLAYLVMLERLRPVERAVFVLHGALEWSHGQIAGALGRSEAACRQILARARRQLSAAPVVVPARSAQTEALARRFLQALGRGDVATLMEALDASAVLLTDGGGRVRAALRPIEGAAHICRLVAGLAAKRRVVVTARMVTVNGATGLLLEHADGRPHAVFGLGFSPDGGRVAAIYNIVNPDKLPGVAP